MASPDADPEQPRGLAGGYGWFASGAASWFGAWGMQQVLFSWLVVGELRASAEWVGLVQTSSMLPGVLLLPLGGMLADRIDGRRLLVALHAFATLPVLGLAAVVRLELLSIPLLVGYGLLMGSVMAFSVPARDSLLTRVSGSDLMRAVTLLTITQFASQATGSLLAGLARVIGTVPALLMQAGLMASGSLTTVRVPPGETAASLHGATATPGARRRMALHEVTEGVRFVLRSRIRAVFLLLCGVGFFFMGPFLVVFPLLVRDFYRGDVGDLARVVMLFPIGTISGSLLLLARGGIARKGLALLGALLVGSAMLIVIGLGLPYWGFLLATFLWGLGGSVFMNSSRTLFQQAAPAGSRARVLAVFQLGFMGTGPLGSLAAGALAERIGTLATLRWFGGCMIVLIACVAGFSSVRSLRDGHEVA